MPRRGDIDFDAAGNLYLSTGDDSNPFDSAGYSPIDERTNRNPAYDAQRSAGNTNDLRGKVLRIKVNANGTYSIPRATCRAGDRQHPARNLRHGLPQPLPAERRQGDRIVYLGDYGPDAARNRRQPGPRPVRSSSTDHGAGLLRLAVLHRHEHHHRDVQRVELRHQRHRPEVQLRRRPDEQLLPQQRPDHAAGGQARLIRYAGDAGSPAAFGSGSESPMGGPVYRYDAQTRRPRSSPPAWTGSTSPASSAALDQAHRGHSADGSPGTIDNFPWNGKQVMDMQFGPDGSLYVLGLRHGYFNGDANSALYRYDYVGTGGTARRRRSPAPTRRPARHPSP